MLLDFLFQINFRSMTFFRVNRNLKKKKIPFFLDTEIEVFSYLQSLGEPQDCLLILHKEET